MVLSVPGTRCWFDGREQGALSPDHLISPSVIGYILPGTVKSTVLYLFLAAWSRHVGMHYPLSMHIR
ncbi:hypothetical protein L211DRAFT_169359 [Terfezia boudieri ATCC MYA-4762]|uniref:Uncharacterized protein n=1 Tax=Terfezia boudieri ATCC MYA-4762 TaxID=1051890 RepID=A0A3N4LNM7_9PEZI|nr:hypothetical protein L211DRAFT_169359 [Terfezia boudieri ATCC MYA-4762]